MPNILTDNALCRTACWRETLDYNPADDNLINRIFHGTFPSLHEGIGALYIHLTELPNLPQRPASVLFLPFELRRFVLRSTFPIAVTASVFDAICFQHPQNVWVDRHLPLVQVNNYRDLPSSMAYTCFLSELLGNVWQSMPLTWPRHRTRLPS